MKNRLLVLCFALLALSLFSCQHIYDRYSKEDAASAEARGRAYIEEYLSHTSGAVVTDLYAYTPTDYHETFLSDFVLGAYTAHGTEISFAVNHRTGEIYTDALCEAASEKACEIFAEAYGVSPYLTADGAYVYLNLSLPSGVPGTSIRGDLDTLYLPMLPAAVTPDTLEAYLLDASRSIPLHADVEFETDEAPLASLSRADILSPASFTVDSVWIANLDDTLEYYEDDLTYNVYGTERRDGYTVYRLMTTRTEYADGRIENTGYDFDEEVVFEKTNDGYRFDLVDDDSPLFFYLYAEKDDEIRKQTFSFLDGYDETPLYWNAQDDGSYVLADGDGWPFAFCYDGVLQLTEHASRPLPVYHPAESETL